MLILFIFKISVEAEAYSYLGLVCDEVRNYPEKAIEYYNKARDLGKSDVHKGPSPLTCRTISINIPYI